MKFTAYRKEPEKEPEQIRIESILGKMTGLVGGPLFMVRVTLTTGKRVVIIQDQDATRKGKDYNFTLQPTPDRRTWIDFYGSILICGRAADDEFEDLELTSDELDELITIPYE
ncbi:MAG: DUF3846 domain-containing protein [Bacteroidales bacterium]|nr:DUF3846 domain-containing protein [Bacteroidales bacterium]